MATKVLAEGSFDEREFRTRVIHENVFEFDFIGKMG